MKPFTTCVHAGAHVEPTTGAIMQPIFATSTYVQEEPGKHKGFDYSRADNPTRQAYEEALATLEGARHGLSFASGLAAVQAVIQLLDPGSRILVCDDVYGGTGRLFRRLFAKYNLDFHFVDMADREALKSAANLKPNLIWIETPTNPMMKVIDIRAMAQIAMKTGALLVVDNTFASPIFQSPLEMGADIVLHSTTKYIGGHSDLIGGALMMSRQDLFESLKFVQFAGGAVPSAFDAYLMHRSLKTLGLRMVQHNKNGMAVAEFLDSHKRIKRVMYPGLKNHPQHSIAAEQMRGFSGMVSFDLDGNYEDVVKFLKKLKIFALAESLGGVESLVNHPEKMTHASVPEEMRKKLGIGPSLIRLSCGIEDTDDLIADLKQALS